jgi:aspartyl-tRNA(Asn)/glutamyl-tRNA(Gln) amidotransferase subunit A
MSDDTIFSRPVRETAARLRAGEVSPTELLELVLERIEATDGEVKAYTTVRGADAHRDAEEAGRELRSGRDRGPLHGLPVSIKDLIDTKGLRTTYGSTIFKDHVPTDDATVVSRLKSAGAVIVGKTNTHEFALGGVTPPTRNPFALDRIPGGSSGGSAAAIAAGSALLSLGSDTGGSIRIPASFCGTVGLKPSYGLVSRVGVFPEAWSLDHIGPITRYVEDAAVLLGAIAGYDTADHTTSNRPVPDYLAELDRGVDGLRIGVPTNHFYDQIDPEIDAAVRDAVEHLHGLGLPVEDVTFPGIDEILGAYTAIDSAEVAANHRRLYEDHARDYQPESKLYVEAGLFVRASTYIDAQRSRAALVARVLESLEGIDVLAVPTQPMRVPHIGDTVATINGQNEDLLLAMIRLLAPFNFTGLPAVSLCCGYDSDGMPIGLQIVGKPYQDAQVLRVAHAYQTSTQWLDRVLALDPRSGGVEGPAAEL